MSLPLPSLRVRASVPESNFAIGISSVSPQLWTLSFIKFLLTIWGGKTIVQAFSADIIH
jgi:hypothetical protein